MGEFCARPAAASPFITCSASWGSVSGSRVGWSGSTDPPNATDRRRRHLKIRIVCCGTGW